MTQFVNFLILDVILKRTTLNRLCRGTTPTKLITIAVNNNLSGFGLEFLVSGLVARLNKKPSPSMIQSVSENKLNSVVEWYAASLLI